MSEPAPLPPAPDDEPMPIGLVGQHPVLACHGGLLPASLLIRDLPVMVNADGANGLTRASVLRAHQLGLYVPPGAMSVPMAAYHPDDWGKRSEWVPAGRRAYGLDAPENGGRRIFGEGDEITYQAWGFVQDAHGDPYVQKPGSAAPGYYLSQTALADPRYPNTDPRRWFDSAALPGWTLPARDLATHGVQLGDFARVSYRGVSIWAQAFDKGNSGELLELSIAACYALGIPDCARSGGVAGGVDIEILPGSGHQTGWMPCASADQINQAGRAAAAAVGLDLGETP